MGLECEYCGADIEEGEEYRDEDDSIICYDCFMDDGSGFEQTISDCW
jgi:hypothetical protein